MDNVVTARFGAPDEATVYNELEAVIESALAGLGNVPAITVIGALRMYEHRLLRMAFLGQEG